MKSGLAVMRMMGHVWLMRIVVMEISALRVFVREGCSSLTVTGNHCLVFVLGEYYIPRFKLVSSRHGF
jgi:hypothetical protein